MVQARFGSICDMVGLLGHVRFTPESRRAADALSCPKSANWGQTTVRGGYFSRYQASLYCAYLAWYPKAWLSCLGSPWNRITRMSLSLRVFPYLPG